MLIDNVYVKINKIDETLSGILSVDLSDHLPILFIWAGILKENQTTFKCWKLYDN